MTPIRTRIRLGSLIQMNEREHVYLVDDAIEVDQVDGYEVTRRRVFFSDVEAVTIHRERPTLALIVLGLVVGLGLLIALAVMRDAQRLLPGFIVMCFTVLPLLLVFLRLVLVPARRICVFGTRTKASMRFGFRTTKAERVFEQICAAVAAARPPSSP